MPRELKDLKELLSICSRKDARCVKVKRDPKQTKFKVRCSKYLYTYVVHDKKKAERIFKSIHPSVKKVEVTSLHKRRSAAKKTTVPK